MLEIRCICVLYLLVTSGTGIITKYVCQGDSVKVFETVTFNSQDTVVSLYMNHQKHTLIAKWHMQNLTIKPHIQPEYKERVYLDEYGNIWIRNVNHWDEESYFIESGINSSYVQHEVKINIMVAPNKNCKPKITHLDKLLIAHLEAEDCGNPVASLLWLDNHGFSNTSGSVINIPPGKEAGIYYACVTGPALECAKISVPSDYCSSYTIGENDSSTLALDILDLKTAISVIVPGIIVIGSLVLLIVALLLIPKIWRRIFIQKEDQHSREEITSFMKSHQPQKKNFDNLKWENIMPLLNDEQKTGLQRYCDKLMQDRKSQLINFDQNQDFGPYRDLMTLNY